MKRLILAVLILLSTTLAAQITSSNLSGKITNSDKEVLEGATVVAIHVPTGTRQHAVSDKNGVYHLNNLTPGGPYTVEIRSIGFQSKTITDIYLTLGERRIIDETLETDVFNLSEVIINAKDESLHHNSGVTSTFSSEQISELPTVSRSLNDLIALTPQAASTTNGLALGGGNYRQSYVTVDGASFQNAYGIGTNLPAGGTPIALDALESISISLAPYDVRQSGFTGGIVNAVTKSGNNQQHVNVYNYFTSNKLNGTEFGRKDDSGHYPDNLKLNRSLENTTGFAISGPIKKNKLFYFINFEYQCDIDQGQTRFARKNESSEWGNGTRFNRPTVAMMDSIRNYLQHTYGYDPGAYQDYSFSTPDYKLLARMDWNINDNNRFTLRYSSVRHQFFSAPSNSITPLSSSLYNKNIYGRGSEYALYFQSSSYYQQQNFSSVAAELNSRFLNGRMNNLFRAVYSKQYEPRELTRDVFPTVDILEPLEDGTKAVYTSFGPDPFTYGTGSKVHTFIATDELSFSRGIHNIVGGLQFELDKTINRFMQGGAGYYVYNSWDDFVNQATPAAFTIAYGNNEQHEQAAPSFNFFQNSLYVQDEMTLTDKFKLMAGLRIEIPYYPSIVDYNINHEFDSLASIPNTTISGLSTADMPKARVDFSPRLGFEWDILGNDKLMLRGGTGLYTGRLPLVWIVTAVCNSNVAQGAYITYNTPMGFYSSVDSIIAHNNDMLFVGDLPASQIATILDKNLQLPQTWKSSLSLEAQLPGGIQGTLEGLFSKDLSSVAFTRLGIIQDDSIQLPGEPTKRAHWASEGIVNSIGGKVTPYFVTNSEQNGYYFALTCQLSKQFNFGLNLMAAYTYSKGKNIFDGIGDQIMTAFSTNTFGVHGSNAHELGYSSYVSPHRALLNAAWTWKTGKHTTETLSCYYEGFNHCFVGSSYTYNRYSYTMSGNVNGDGGANSLIYIPTEEQLLGSLASDFVSTENAAAFNEFIKSDKYLASHRGQYAERGGVIAPWRHTLNLRYDRSYRFENGETVSFGCDVKNFANLLYRGWGNIKQLGSSDILVWSDGKYQFRQPEWSDYAGVLSTWSAALNIRFSF